MRTQMMAEKAGALVDSAKQWKAIDWQETRRQVRVLQMRIAKAVNEGRPGKAKALQWLLTHSFNAKLLAVKRVTTKWYNSWAAQQGLSLKCLSRVKGNFHARFLGGDEPARALPYPVFT